MAELNLKTISVAVGIAAAGVAGGRASAPTETVEIERVEYAPARPVDDIATTACVEGIERAQLEYGQIDKDAARAVCAKAKPSLTNAAEYAARKIAVLGPKPNPDQLRAVVNDEVEALAQAGMNSAQRDWQDRYEEALAKCKPLPGSSTPRCVAPRPGAVK